MYAMPLNKTTKILERAVLTIATGKPIYISMAINLARSFKWWHKNSSIQFVLVTDQKDLVPPDLSDIEVIELQVGQLGQGFAPKLYLEQLTPAHKTLFIDADCLCFGSLETVFDRFETHSVSAIGDTISQGEFFGDVANICQQFQINALPRFVGGLYYLEKNEISKRVFNTARELEAKYDDMGLVRLRGHRNEEPLIAIAMALNEQNPLSDDGTIKAERMCYQHRMKADVFQGIAKLWNHCKNSQDFPTWVHLTEASPIIVHFNGFYIESEPYTSEVIRLQRVMANGWPIWAATVYTFITFFLPKTVIRYSQRVLRPWFRKFFGFRKISPSTR
jgi:hypothetical protein